ncbi:MAG TPA: P22 phage major capsid protein family protein [Xanthobacteraceae bacterium]|nr:P22 phage major capsid protein family protein [Xanthobacteraceae bacterium]
MPNSVLTPSVIAKEALMLLDNNLVLGNLVNRAYEDEMQKPVNGYKKGGSVQIRRPAKYTWRAGAVASPQDTTEKSLTLTVDTQGGVDLAFSSADMTLKISEFSERFLKPAMITIANQIDRDIAALYQTVWNWVGVPGQTIDGFSDFGKAPQRLTEMAVPEDRCGVLSPADKWGLLGSLTGSFVQDISKSAIERARLPMVGGVELYETQNVRTHTVGSKAGTPLVNGGSQATTYAASGSANAQSLVTDGWSNSSAVLKQGDVITIAGVFAINPVTKDVLPYLQQFVINADVSSDGSGNATLNVSPAIITSGAYQTVSAQPADNAAITVLGSAAGNYPQNMVFHKNAFALVMVPMEIPAGVPSQLVGRETYKGISVRLVPYYDGINDVSNWRLDVLYAVKSIFPDLATRVSGT